MMQETAKKTIAGEKSLIWQEHLEFEIQEETVPVAEAGTFLYDDWERKEM